MSALALVVIVLGGTVTLALVAGPGALVTLPAIFYSAARLVASFRS